MVNHEEWSAMMDGELDPSSQGKCLTSWKHHSDVRVAWDMYHLIGETLREQQVTCCDLERRIAKRLQDEPTVLAPATNKPVPAREMIPAYRWVAVAAAVAVVAGVSGLFKSPATPESPGNVVALQETRVIPVADHLPAAPDPEAERYVAMHQQWATLSGFQSVDYNPGVPGTK